MDTRFLIIGILGLFLATSVVAAPPSEFTNWGGLTDEEVLIHNTGKREMRMDEASVEEVKQWEFIDANGNPDQAKLEEMHAFIQENRKTSYNTVLNPFLVAGLVTDVDKMVTRTYSGRIDGLRFGSETSQEDIDQFMTDAGFEEVSEGVYKKGSDTYEFKNVEMNWYFQNEPNKNSNPNNRADFGSGSFDTKYTKVTKSFETFTVKSDATNPPFSHPGNIAFDAGVNDDDVEQPLEASQTAGNSGELDYTCEVFVELKGDLVKNGVVSKFENMAEVPVARTTVYVEDYVPPMPEELGSLEVQANTERLQPGDSNGNSFVPPMTRFHANDGTGVTVAGMKNPESDPVEMYYWPNNDPVNRDGDGYNDYTWDEIAMANNNDNDLAVNNTFNYEVGMSLYQRVKYKDDPSTYGENTGWKFIYYVPYRPVNNVMRGPYAGAVHSAAIGMDGYDKYDVDHGGGDYFAEYYKPIVFPESLEYNGDTFYPLGLINEIYGMGDAGVEVQQNKTQLQNDYGFQYISGISVKWNRECVQGITVGNTGEPALKIPEATMLLPTGWASARVATLGRQGNFEAQYDNSDGGPTSLTGTVADGNHARDSFFKINAADCCNNDVVIASGTYGSEDNLKPIPKLVIEEMDSHDGTGSLYLDVATIPNDLTGAGNPIGDYNPDKVYSKLHDSAVPLYGTGVQGNDIRGYGNFSNNAATWNGFAQAQTMQNPVDNSQYSYLSMRYFENEPPFEEDRRYQVTITADDNIGPTVEPGAGTVAYPIQHLSYVFYYHPTIQTVDAAPAEVRQVFAGDPNTVRESVSTTLQNAGFKVVDRGAVVDVDPNAPQEDWTREPSATFEYKFKSPGLWVVRVDAVDRSANGRVMLVPFSVGDVNMKTRSIELDSKRID